MFQRSAWMSRRSRSLACAIALSLGPTAASPRRSAARRTAAVFALNVGLDALYLVAGATAYALGAAHSDDGLRGGGVASMAQGAFLLGFDLWGWIASDANADRFVR